MRFPASRFSARAGAGLCAAEGRIFPVCLAAERIAAPPGLEEGGIINAIVGTIIVTLIASAIAVPVGIGGGIYLAEFSRSGSFASFVRFGTNVLAGVPSIICGVFVYGLIVSTRVLFGRASALAGGIALSLDASNGDQDHR